MGKREETQSPAAVEQEGEPETVMVPIDVLLPADSPRISGVDVTHAIVLSEIENELPPILVQQGSMRIVDGMHRLYVARLRGHSHIAARFFEGNDEAAFLRAVTANVVHGLPLSMADRQAAAIRIMRSHPHWSDRAVADATGLSGRTVANVRDKAGDELPRPAARVGRDGRVRPVDGRARRQIVGELISSRPTASLREIASAAGVSPATVRDVRDRLARGDEPTTDNRRQTDVVRVTSTHSAPRDKSAQHTDEIDPIAMVNNLRQDPSVRYTDSGRALLRWLDRRMIEQREYEGIIASIPLHCLPAVAQLARHSASIWNSLYDRLDARIRDETTGTVLQLHNGGVRSVSRQHGSRQPTASPWRHDESLGQPVTDDDARSCAR